MNDIWITPRLKLNSMKIFCASLFFLSTLFSASANDWGHNLQEAIKTAKESHKCILLNFSGSDWCGPCIKLHKEVFTSDDFISIATQKLVLVNADFPRNKKNQLSAAQQKLNDDMAEQYNTKGDFPLTVLLDANGKVVKSWVGFPKSITDFLEDLQTTIQAQP
jgi:thioredoxin-related protein